jgi:hypothetical protein
MKQKTMKMLLAKNISVTEGLYEVGMSCYGDYSYEIFLSNIDCRQTTVLVLILLY